MNELRVDELYAVSTTQSVFYIHVLDDGYEAMLDRVAHRGNLLRYPESLNGGRFVGITVDCGVTKYSASISEGRPVCACKTNIAYWGGKTSPLVALFPHLKTAMECAKSEDLQPWDKRWIDITRYMIDAIGRDHPYIIFCDEVPYIAE